jgi:hypothetical protein
VVLRSHDLALLPGPYNSGTAFRELIRCVRPLSIEEVT